MFCNLVRQGTVIENDFKENNWLSKAALRLFTLMKISHWSVGREGHYFFDKYHTIEILNEIEKEKKQRLMSFYISCRILPCDAGNVCYDGLKKCYRSQPRQFVLCFLQRVSRYL